MAAVLDLLIMNHVPLTTRLPHSAPPLSRGLNATLKTVLLLGALSTVMVALGAALGGGYAVLGIVFAVALNAMAYFHSDKLVLAMHHARALPEHEAPVLHDLIRG